MIVTTSIVFLISLWLYILTRRTAYHIPRLQWHFNKSANLDFIRDLLSAGQLPKVYKSKIAGFEISKNFFIGIEGPIVIADYDLLRRLFSNENISSRLDNKSLCLEEKLIRSDYQLDETATNIFRREWIEGRYGLGNGPYDRTHRLLRTKWSQIHNAREAKLGEMIVQNSMQLIDVIKSEMETYPEGFEPLDMLMNVSMNVVTYFCMGENFLLKDKEFIHIADMVKELFKWLMIYVKAKIVALKTPTWLIKQKLFRDLKFKLFPGYKNMCDELYTKFYPYLFEKIKEHMDTIDYDAPRDFMDTMLNEANNNESEIGYHTIAMSIVGLYLGGSDTVSNTIRWAFLILTEYPEVQERCYEEILEQTSEEGRANIDSSKCHYTQSVLLECRRLHPVADSLPHQATEDIYFENYYFPAGTTFFGSLFAIMHNPKDFPEPETFKPERFLDKDEKFQNDPKVCSFSAGKRNCVGQYLAKNEYFQYVARVLLNFRLIRTEGKIEPDPTIQSINVPKKFKIKFIVR